MQNAYVTQRDQYRPAHAKAVFVLDLPSDPELFFYDPAGLPSEALFRALMQTLFNRKFATKEEGLRAFQEAGYAVVHPSYSFRGARSAKIKKAAPGMDLDPAIAEVPDRQLAEYYPALREELNVFCNKHNPGVKVLLIKSGPFRAYADKLIADGYPVANEGNVIPFPLRHHFKMFQKKIHKALGLSDVDLSKTV